MVLHINRGLAWCCAYIIRRDGRAACHSPRWPESGLTLRVKVKLAQEGVALLGSRRRAVEARAEVGGEREIETTLLRGV